MNSIKKMMLSGALGCLISGMAYADGSSPQPVKPPSPLDLRKARTIPY